MTYDYSRRRVLATVVAGSTIGLAGCLGGDSDNSGNETDNGADGDDGGNGTDESGNGDDGSNGTDGGGNGDDGGNGTDESGNGDDGSTGTDESGNGDDGSNETDGGGNGDDGSNGTDNGLPSEPAGVFGQFQADAANTGRGPEVSVPDNPSVDWQYPEGGGFTVVGPIYVNGVLYAQITEQNENDAGVTTTFVTLDATTGEVLQEWDLSAGNMPVYSNGTLYVLDGTTLRAISTDDRSELWATPDALDSSGQLTLAGDTVYGYGTKSGTGNVLRAFSTADGSMRWEQPVVFSGFIAESPVAVDDTTVYASGDMLQAFAREGGTEQWSVDEKGPYTNAPTLVGDTLYVGTDGGQIVGYDTANGTETVAVQTASSFGFDRSLAHSDGLLFAKQSALDTETGELAWEREGDVSSTPTVAGDTFLAVGTNTTQPLVAIDRNDGSLVWQAGSEIEQGLQGGAQIFAVGSRVYAGYNGQIVALS